MATTLFRLLRVKQYSKNAFVLAALLFTKGYEKPHLVLLTLGAFAAMCLLSSATYVVNDVVDRERDRAHPRKRHRPIASGAVGVRPAILGATFLLAGGLALGYAVAPGVFFGGLAYLALQLAYNLGLKAAPVADVFVIATGFVVRVVAGALAIDARVSGWILLCTGSLALLLGFAKRRAEFLTEVESRGRTRESLAGYTQPALDALVVLSAGGSAVFYGLYGIESPTARQYPGLLLTVPFVAYGICRYVVLTFGEGDTAEPETLVLRDRGLLLALALFLAAALAALGGLRFGFVN